MTLGPPERPEGLRGTHMETYRHALAVTAARPGVDGSLYVYTLNMAGPQERWADLEAGFRTGRRWSPSRSSPQGPTMWRPMPIPGGSFMCTGGTGVGVAAQ